MGSRPGKGIQGLVVRSEKQGEFKETKSLYNESDREEEKEEVMAGVEGQQSMELVGE